MWRILHIIPVAVPAEALAVFAGQVPESIIDPGVTVEFRAPTAGPMNMIDSAYERTLADAAVLAVGAGAESEGFAAVVINSMTDSALKALRSRLSIPVVGACETALMYAAQLGRRLGVVTMWPPWRDLYAPAASSAGLADRLVSVRDIGTRPDAEELLTGKEHTVFPLLESACRAAIDEDGAEVLILGSTTMHQSHRYLSERLEVPVINPGLVAHQFTQTLLRSGLRHSRRTYRPPAAPADSLLTGTFSR